jgi:hypothetical protein
MTQEAITLAILWGLVVLFGAYAVLALVFVRGGTRESDE